MQTLRAHKITMMLAFETLLGRKFIFIFFADFKEILIYIEA